MPGVDGGAGSGVSGADAGGVIAGNAKRPAPSDIDMASGRRRAFPVGRRDAL